VNASDENGVQHQGERTYYMYDATGQRVRKTTERQNGTVKNERIYLGGFEIYREYNGSGTSITLERQTLHVMDDKRRVTLVETKTIDNGAPPNSLPSSVTRYQYDNHLGSACLELDEAAAVISYEEYYPYGGTSYQAGRSAAEVSLKRYRYVGRERDEETGFSYHGARYYAPWLGRWTACDPAGLREGNNLYRFCLNNPLKLTDTNGLQATSVVGKINDVEAPELGMEIKATPPGQRDSESSNNDGTKSSPTGTGAKPDGASKRTEDGEPQQPSAGDQQAHKPDRPEIAGKGGDKSTDRMPEESSEPAPEERPTAPKGSVESSIPSIPAATTVTNSPQNIAARKSPPHTGTTLATSGAQKNITRTGSNAAGASTDAKHEAATEPFFIVSNKDKPFLGRGTKLKTSKWSWTKYVFAPFVLLGYWLIKATASPQGLSRLGRTLKTFTTTMFFGFLVFGAIRDMILPGLASLFKAPQLLRLAKQLGGENHDSTAVDFPWSVVHHLAGWIFFFMGAPFLTVAALTVGWEIFEMFAQGFGEDEINANRLFDIGLAWAGWGLAALLHAL
jgi:RHS repeat-associated protein